jgi:hypothetical protein
MEHDQKSDVEFCMVQSADVHFRKAQAQNSDVEFRKVQNSDPECRVPHRYFAMFRGSSNSFLGAERTTT